MHRQHELYEELKKLVAEYNVPIITAQQATIEETGWTWPQEVRDLLIVDTYFLIK